MTDESESRIVQQMDELFVRRIAELLDRVRQEQSGCVVREYLSVAEICTMTGLSDDSVRRAIYSHELPASDMSRKDGDRPRYLIKRDDVERWIDAHQTRPAPVIDHDLERRTNEFFSSRRKKTKQAP